MCSGSSPSSGLSWFVGRSNTVFSLDHGSRGFCRLGCVTGPDCSCTGAEAQVQRVDQGRFQKCLCFTEDDETLLLWDVEMLVIRDLWRSLVQPLFGTGPYPALSQVSYGFIKHRLPSKEFLSQFSV